MAKGYTKIDNDYFTALASLDLTGSEFRVLLFLLRNSVSFKRDYTKECAASYIAESIGMSDRQIKRILNSLLAKKLIYLDVNHSSKKGNSYFISSDKLGYLKGQIWSVSGDTLVQLKGHFGASTGDKDVTPNVTNMSHKENKEDNSIENKEKERASLTFSDQKLSLEELARLSQEDEDGDL